MHLSTSAELGGGEKVGSNPTCRANGDVAQLAEPVAAYPLICWDASMNNKGRSMVRAHPSPHNALETLLVKPTLVMWFKSVRIRPRAPCESYS